MQKPAIMLGASHQQTHITLQTDSAAGGSVTVERGRKTIDGVIIFLLLLLLLLPRGESTVASALHRVDNKTEAA